MKESVFTKIRLWILQRRFEKIAHKFESEHGKVTVTVRSVSRDRRSTAPVEPGFFDLMKLTPKLWGRPLISVLPEEYEQLKKDIQESGQAKGF